MIVHAADNAFPDWPAFNEMAGIGGWRSRNEQAGPYWYWKDGKLVSDVSPGPAGEHGARLPFQVTTRDSEHPIMKGLPPVWMHANDELYGKLRGPGKNITVLEERPARPHSKTPDPFVQYPRDNSPSAPSGTSPELSASRVPLPPIPCLVEMWS